MTNKQEVGYVLKKMGNKYLIGDTPNVDTRKGYFRDAFDTAQGKMKLAKEGKLNEQKPIPMDTPNEFAYLDFKKYAYKKRGMFKKEI